MEVKKDIYNDHTYLTNNPTWHEEDAGFKVERILRILSSYPIVFSDVCEVGCGSGEILSQLQSHFPNVKSWTGYDISEDAIKIARMKANANLNFVLGDFTKSEQTKTFDLILIIDVIEHLEDYFKFIDSIKSRGKYFLFHIPLDMCVWSLFREGILIESKKRVGHIHNFTEDFIISILQDHGFSILKKIYTEPVSKVKSFKQRIIDVLRNTIYKVSPRFSSKTLGGYSIMILAEGSNS